jgi:hypothetical protein
MLAARLYWHRAGRARVTYERNLSVLLLLSASESAATPASLIGFSSRLQQGERRVRNYRLRNRAAGTEQGARDLRERRQRRVALERLRKRHGALVTDLVLKQPAAKRGGSGMLVARLYWYRAGRARLTGATSASRCS